MSRKTQDSRGRSVDNKIRRIARFGFDGSKSRIVGESHQIDITKKYAQSPKEKLDGIGLSLDKALVVVEIRDIELDFNAG